MNRYDHYYIFIKERQEKYHRTDEENGSSSFFVESQRVITDHQTEGRLRFG